MKRQDAAKMFKSYIREAEEKRSIVVVIPVRLAHLIYNGLTEDVK